MDKKGMPHGARVWLFTSAFTFLALLIVPVTPVLATSGIANQVAAFCAPEPTVPDVGSCSACHATTNNRGPNDLTAAGMWSLSTATFSNFCPAATTPPPVPNPPTPDPTPPSTPPGGPADPNPPPTGMGMGSGGDLDDDDDDGDDDDDESEIDDDDDGGGSGALQRIRARLSALRNRISRNFGRSSR